MTYKVYARYARDEAEANKREVYDEILKVAGIQAPMSAYVLDPLTIKHAEEKLVSERNKLTHFVAEQVVQELQDIRNMQSMMDSSLASSGAACRSGTEWLFVMSRRISH